MAATIPDELLDLMSEKFRMLSDSTRLAILRTLMQGERNVTGVNSRASRARDQIQAALFRHFLVEVPRWREPC